MSPQATSADAIIDLVAANGRNGEPEAIDLGGTIRSLPARATLDRVRTVFPRLGITRLADVTGLDSIGVPVAMCIRPNARHLSVSQGKGISIDLAMASAAMESVEMYHAEHVESPARVAAWTDLDEPALRPDTIELGVRRSPSRDDEAIGWSPGADLLTAAPTLVPHVLLDLDSTRTHPDAGLFAVSSNGLASGNCLVEAILHGLYEVIERDADLRFGMLDPARQEDRRLALGDTGLDHIDELTGRIRACPWVRLEAWDTTGEVGVPSFRAALRDLDTGRNLGSFVGTGCHRSPEIALSRALTEAAQTRLTLIAGSRDDVFPSYYRRRSVPSEPTLLPGPRRITSDDPSPSRDRSFGADLAHVLDRLRAIGIRHAAVFDHTDPGIGVTVVKVIVPDLRMNRLEPAR